MPSQTLSQQTSKFFQRVQKRIYSEYRLLRQPMVEIEGVKIRLGNYMSRVMQDCFYKGEYEQHEIALIKAKLEPTDIVMEIGAGIGFISTYCAKKIGSDRVFAFEANPTLASHIHRTYKLNQVSPQLNNCMVGEEEGIETFYLEPHFWSSSAVKKRSSKAKAVKVSVKSLNQEIKRINPSFLIIDIEGGEYSLIKTANFHNVRKLAIELHERVIGKEKTDFVRAKLAEAGFKVNEELSLPEELYLER